jgi:hypothetical protein
LTVYLRTSDTPGHSNSDATCLKFWPPVLARVGGRPPIDFRRECTLTGTKTHQRRLNVDRWRMAL